ncbi:putative protein phosphatase methylesterase 1 [Tetrabaena socialis]|uniref:protein phosphatase methylesterase-1 n=1 Tax=Tetrabaena socialis TaxID=47790 RepID=A0A2J7ZX07_9CHLO|nr:putative protein phosphatase methylesterase 1 [Tetrabaena socialis]|eukprot:PNH04810.1 putative protein phosphatase methylesterase 1 [Tetrabaena socialis]
MMEGLSTLKLRSSWGGSAAAAASTAATAASAFASSLNASDAFPLPPPAAAPLARLAPPAPPSALPAAPLLAGAGFLAPAAGEAFLPPAAAAAVEGAGGGGSARARLLPVSCGLGTDLAAPFFGASASTITTSSSSSSSSSTTRPFFFAGGCAFWGLARPTIPAGVFAVPRPRGPTAMPGWQVYWDERRQVHLPSRGGTVNVYLAGGSGPVVLCVHGGGYTGLTWSLVAAKLKLGYRVVAPDMRGHGLTATDSDTDFSRQTMADDIVAIWEHLFGGAGGTAPAAAGGTAGTAGGTCSGTAAAAAPIAGGATSSSGQGAAAGTGGATASATHTGPPDARSGQPSPPASHGPPTEAAPAPPSPDGPPAVVLVGHSMGGGLAVWAAAARRIQRLEGVVVLDVVEGTALGGWRGSNLTSS